MRLRRSTISVAVFVAFAAIALFFFVTEHGAHAFGLLPHVLLLVCVALLYFAGAGDRAGDSNIPMPEAQDPAKEDRS